MDYSRVLEFIIEIDIPTVSVFEPDFYPDGSGYGRINEHTLIQREDETDAAFCHRVQWHINQRVMLTMSTEAQAILKEE